MSLAVQVRLSWQAGEAGAQRKGWGDAAPAVHSQAGASNPAEPGSRCTAESIAVFVMKFRTWGAAVGLSAGV